MFGDLKAPGMGGFLRAREGCELGRAGWDSRSLFPAAGRCDRRSLHFARAAGVLLAHPSARAVSGPLSPSAAAFQPILLLWLGAWRPRAAAPALAGSLLFSLRIQDFSVNGFGAEGLPYRITIQLAARHLFRRFPTWPAWAGPGQPPSSAAQRPSWTPQL